MYRFILIITLLFYPFVQSAGQKDEFENIILIEYIYSDNYFKDLETLIVDGSSKAVYIRQPLGKLDNSGEIQRKDENYSLPAANYMTGSHKYFMKSNATDIYMHTMAIDKNKYVVKDSTVNYNWTIDNKSSKMLSNYKCIKATTNFRGRSYVAYFAPDIPSSFGPYKFKGLPGLILEIYSLEEDNIHHWVARKIVSNVNPSTTYFPVIEDYEDPLINMHQFQNINNKLRLEKSKRENSRIPSGVTLESTSRTNLSIEKIFEWELENDKN